MTDLVVVSLEVWDEVWRRNQHLIAGLLRRGRVDRVLFVEPVVDVAHDLRHGRKPDMTGLREIPLSTERGRLWTLRLPKVLPRRVDPRGDSRRARAVVKAAHRLDMQRPVLWVNDPVGAEVLTASGWPSFYDVTDDWVVADRPGSELRRLRGHEKTLVQQCQAVVVCSRALLRRKSGRTGVVLIPNAVDVDLYRIRRPRPSDLPPGPLALYLGTAHRDRVDVELLAKTAEVLRKTAGGSVVLVGPSPLPQADRDRLVQAGVCVLGPRPSSAVPSYLQNADVLIVPHVLTDFTASLDPIKAYEYRAARRPVVSTPVPGFVDSNDPFVTVASAADFPQMVATIAETSVPWTSEMPGDIPTWVQRVEEMAAVITKVEGASL